MRTINADMFFNTLREKMKYYRIFNPSLVPGLFLASQLLQDQLKQEQEELIADMKPRYYAVLEPTEYDKRCVGGEMLCGTCEHRYWHDPECSDCNERNGYKYYTANIDGR